ncbi:MAG: zinc-ribbon domain-containing protein [Mediterraneibacter faecis]
MIENEKKPTEVTAFANSKAWWKCKTCGYGGIRLSLHAQVAVNALVAVDIHL